MNILSTIGYKEHNSEIKEFENKTNNFNFLFDENGEIKNNEEISKDNYNKVGELMIEMRGYVEGSKISKNSEQYNKLNLCYKKLRKIQKNYLEKKYPGEAIEGAKNSEERREYKEAEEKGKNISKIISSTRKKFLGIGGGFAALIGGSALIVNSYVGSPKTVDNLDQNNSIKTQKVSHENNSPNLSLIKDGDSNSSVFLDKNTSKIKTQEYLKIENINISKEKLQEIFIKDGKFINLVKDPNSRFVSYNNAIIELFEGDLKIEEGNKKEFIKKLQEEIGAWDFSKSDNWNLIIGENSIKKLKNYLGIEKEEIKTEKKQKINIKESYIIETVIEDKEDEIVKGKKEPKDNLKSEENPFL